MIMISATVRKLTERATMLALYFMYTDTQNELQMNGRFESAGPSRSSSLPVLPFETRRWTGKPIYLELRVIRQSRRAVTVKLDVDRGIYTCSGRYGDERLVTMRSRFDEVVERSQVRSTSVDTIHWVWCRWPPVESSELFQLELQVRKRV